MTGFVPRSSIREIVWPGTAVGENARSLALQYQYRQSERWDAETLRAHQWIQLRHLLTHADRTMPFWRTRLRDAGILPDTALTPEIWSRIPILTRAQTQDAGTALHCRSIPAAHGEITTAATSGSTGRPLNVIKTDVQQIFWKSFLIREMFWQKVDFRAKNGSIRTMRDITTKPGAGLRLTDWGAPINTLSTTGPGVMFEIRRPIAEQAAWLLREDPEYLLTFSSNFALLAQYFRDSARRPKRLRKLRGFAEIVTPDARALCREVFGTEIIDAYTAEEIGYIALQCPDHAPSAQLSDEITPLHVMAEGVYLEVLDEAGKPCGPGEIGRVVVTPLHNFAMPLLRYEIGDYAECGGPCPCGRGLAVLNRIIGRSRDRVIMPDGTGRAAFFGSKKFYQVPAIRQFQGAQTARNVIELRLVVRHPLTLDEESLITGLVRDDLDPSFQVRFVYVDEIPRRPSGKIEEFRCEIE